MSADVVTFPTKQANSTKRATGERVRRPRPAPSAAAEEKGQIAQEITHLQGDLERLVRALGEATLRLHRLRV